MTNDATAHAVADNLSRLMDLVETRLPQLYNIITSHQDRLEALELIKDDIAALKHLARDLAVVAAGYASLSDRITALEGVQEKRSAGGVIVPN